MDINTVGLQQQLLLLAAQRSCDLQLASFFFGEGLFFEIGLKDLFKLTQKYCHFRKAKETGTMFERIIL